MAHLYKNIKHTIPTEIDEMDRDIIANIQYPRSPNLSVETIMHWKTAVAEQAHTVIEALRLYLPSMPSQWQEAKCSQLSLTPAFFKTTTCLK